MSPAPATDRLATSPAMLPSQGDLLCCERCPATYHLECLGPQQHAPADDEDWFCPLCCCAACGGSSFGPPLAAPPASQVGASPFCGIPALHSTALHPLRTALVNDAPQQRMCTPADISTSAGGVERVGGRPSGPAWRRPPADWHMGQRQRPVGDQGGGGAGAGGWSTLP